MLHIYIYVYVYAPGGYRINSQRLHPAHYSSEYVAKRTVFIQLFCGKLSKERHICLDPDYKWEYIINRDNYGRTAIP